jgi:hypothetical protein
MVGTPLVGEQSENKTWYTVTKAQTNTWFTLYQREVRYIAQIENISIMQDNQHCNHQLLQVNCIRAKLCHAKIQYNNNFSENKKNKHQDSTVISPRDCQKATLSSLHFILPPRKTLVSGPGPAELLSTRPAPAWHDDQYHCCDNHGNLTICRAVPVPIQSIRPGCC